MAATSVLAIDQGTTSTRAVVYDKGARPLGSAAKEITQHFPKPGWVEHDADEIWQTVSVVVPQALAQAKVAAKDLAGIGITNQRETTVLWDRSTGQPVGRALVWQDRRTTDFCRSHHTDEPWLHERTGLVLDPYFSATKVRWLLENGDHLRHQAEQGKLAFGTIDSFLIYRLTAAKVHATDVTNASRTLLLNLQSAAWDRDLLRYFDVPEQLLPEVRPSSADFGRTAGLGFLPDGIPIAGVAGDQQAALFGQCGFAAGDAKCTYGTGAFFLLHTGESPTLSKHRLLSTLAATVDQRPQYALEGSIFVAGAAVQWLRDGLKLIASSADVEGLAAQAEDDDPILFVPAFVGLGAPHWVPEARGVVFGVTRGTGAVGIARAALEGVAFQVVDLIDAAGNDSGKHLTALRVDGGMTRNAWFMQQQANLLGLPVLQAPDTESTALGAAYLAGLRVGVWSDLDQLRAMVQPPRRFDPKFSEADRSRQIARWRRAVQTVIAFYQNDAAV